MSTPTILDYYKYSVLATAAYVRMGDNPLTGAKFAEIAASDEQARLPSSLGNYLFDPQGFPNPTPWTILRYYGSDIPSSRDPIAAQDKSGLGATLFQLGANGEKVLAIRGTEPFTDGAVDLTNADLGQIGVLGLALTQVVAAVNLIQRMLATPGTNVEQIHITTSIIPPTSGAYLTVSGVPPMFVSFSKGTLVGAGTGELSDGSRITVTGHSLGGNVAYAVSRLFPDLVKPDVYLYNSAGYDPLTADFLVPATLAAFPIIKTHLVNEFGLSALGVVPLANQLTNPALDLIVKTLRNGDARQGTPTVINLRSESIVSGDDLDIVASALTGANRYPSAVEFPMESNNHVVEPSMDALALLATLYSLNDTFTIPQLTRLLEVGSAQLARSEEGITEALFKLLVPGGILLGGRHPELPISDAVSVFGTSKGDLAARSTFYDAILRIQDAIKNKSGQLLLSLADTSTSDLITFARDPEALAMRYALRELNPFIVLDTQNEGIYTQFQVGGALQGALDLYDAATRSGTITDDWIAARAAFMTWKNLVYTADALTVGGVTTLLRPEFSHESRARFDDLASGKTVALADAVLPPNDTTARRLVFGGDQSDLVEGASRADRLYGGGGTDYLRGKAEADYLEGGTGLDIYEYNGYAGIIGSNDGSDTIHDTDGKGVLRYVWNDRPAPQSTIITDASVKVVNADNQWRSADGKFVYTRSTNSEGRTDLTITISDDAEGTLTLKDFRDGDFGIRLWDARAVPLTSNSINSDSTTITDTAANDLIVGGASDNHVPATQGGNDWINGGGGRDRIEAGLGNDLVEGGAGTTTGGDIVDGGAGDDVLYGDVAVAWGQAIVTGRTAAGTGLRGDWLSGGVGSDVLLGGDANDVLVGGRGADLLIGGGGDDNIGGGAQWVATSLDWNYQDLGNNVRFFAPISGEDAPTDDVGDVAYGGAGKDYLWGGYGDDVLFGEADNDYLGGQWGDDILTGGDGADVLEGDDAYFTVAESGSDYLDGGAGNDELFGYGGDDVLIGGAGNDMLAGGAGKDIYVFNKGDGADAVFDESQGIEKSILVRADNFDSSKLKIFPGSLILDFGDGDSIHLTNFDVYDSNSSPAFEHLTFADGISMSFEDVIAIGFDFDGTEENDDGHDATHPVLIGTAFDDRIRGHGGNDLMIGLQGGDTLDGGTGSDRLFGDSGNDILMGGDDMDALISGDGDDALHGGMAIDYAWGGAGNDYLEGGGGQDNLFGELGDDIYVFDEQDAVRDFLGATTIIFISNERPDDIELRQLVVNSLPVYTLKRSVEAGGDPFAFGMGITLSSADQLAGMTFADGTQLTGQDMLHQMLVDGYQLASSTAGDDEILGYAGSENIAGGDGNDSLFGYRGSDQLSGDAGNDWLDGGNGADQLYGGEGDDTLIGGTGNDQLFGGDGSDSYVFARGDGQDVISEGGDTSATDVLRLDGMLSGDVALTREANGDLKVGVIGTSESITVAGYYNNLASRIERIEFADGATVETADLSALAVSPIEGTSSNEILVGTPYADILLGHEGTDTLDGHGGNDVLDGGTGVDTYKLNLVAGNALLVEDGAENSVIRIPDGLKFSQLQVQRSGDDLVLGIQGSQGTVTVPGYYTGQINWTVTTSTGGSKSLGELITYLGQNAQPPQTVQELEQDYLDDAHLQYQIYLASFGASGGIRVNVQAPSDDPVILRNPPFSETEENGLIFLNIADITAGGSDNVLDFRQRNVVIADAGGGNDLINNQGFGFSDSSIGTIGSFLDGNQGDDKILGSWAADTLIGGAGDDYLAGSDGNDTYVIFGADSGMDIIDEVITNVNLPVGHFAFAGGRDSMDTLEFVGVNLEDVTFSKGQYNATLVGGTGTYTTFDITWETDRHARLLLPNPGDPALAAFPGESYGIETVRFSDGAVLTLGDMLTLAPLLPSVIFGDTGADSISGTSWDDTIYGGSGNDSINGFDGNDTIYGDAGNDSLNGDAFGGTGNDTLDGGPGNDALNGFGGNNTYLFGYGGGQDVITSFFQLPPLPQIFISSPPSFDTLQFLPGVTRDDVTLEQASNGLDLLLKLKRSQDQVTIGRWFVSGATGTAVFQVTFSDGTVWSAASINSELPATVVTLTDNVDFFNGGGASLKYEIHGMGGNDTLAGGNNADVIAGGAGNDQLFGVLGDDTLIGGVGNDTLTGGEGSDTYAFDLSWGVDTISELDASAPSDVDVLRFGSGILPDAITIDLDSDLHIRIDGVSDEVKVLDWNGSSGSRKIERIEFADGTVWDLADIEGHLSGAQINSSGASDILTGTAFSEVLQGGPGDEWLNGEGGDDILVGGAGDDLLFGGPGADTYVFNPGDGVDTIYDPSMPGESNTVVFGDGITSDSLSLGIGSLLVRVGTDGDALHFQSFDPANPYITRDVDVFRFADGSALSYEQLLARGFDVRGAPGDDELGGTTITDRISGFAGNDTLVAGAGDDTLDGGAGNDILTGGPGNDAYLFGLGSGSDFIEDASGDFDSVFLGDGIVPGSIKVSRSGSTVTLRMDGSTDELSLHQEVEGDFRIEQVRFVDGTVWDPATLESKVSVENTAPFVSIPLADQTTQEDAPFSFQVSVGAFADVDAEDTLIYSASLADDSAFPSWLSFDPATRVFNGTPQNNDVGTVSVKVVATDSSNTSAFDVFDLTIVNTNDAPTLVNPIADQTRNQNAPFAFQLPEGTFADVDVSDSLTLGATLADGSPLPGWLTFNSASGSFSGTPTEFDVGDWAIAVTATDTTGASASGDFTLSVSDASVVNETHVGTRYRDAIVTGFANDWVEASDGNDLVRSGAGRDTLLGGGGHDRLEGGAGNDTYVHQRRGGHDVIGELGGQDVLRLGEGIAANQTRLYRSRDDLVVDLHGTDGKVTIEGWFASDAVKVENIEFTDGTVWDEDYIRNHLTHGQPMHEWNDGENEHHDDHGFGDRDQPGVKRDEDDGRDKHEPQRSRDRMAKLLEAYLAHEPGYDFEVYAREVERDSRHEPALNPQQIAARWRKIDRYLKDMEDDPDGDARGAAGDWRFDAVGLMVEGWPGGGFGYVGPAGLARGTANLRKLEGLGEGFHQLRT